MKSSLVARIAATAVAVTWLGCGDDSSGSGGAGGTATTGAQSTSTTTAGPTTSVGPSTSSTQAGPGVGGGGASSVSGAGGDAPTAQGTGGTGGLGSGGDGTGGSGTGGDGTGGAGTGGDGTGGQSGPTSGSGGASACEPLSGVSCARCPDVIGQPECGLADLCDGNFGTDYTDLVACACGDGSPCADACDDNLCTGADISGGCDACVHASCNDEMLECLNNGPHEDNCGLDCNGLLNDAIVVEDGCQMEGALLMYDLLDCACDPGVGACVVECELSLCDANVPYGACRACVEAQCGDPFQACLDHI